MARPLSVTLLVTTVVLLGGGAALLWWGNSVIREAFKDEYAAFHRITPGMSEEQVRTLLGEPYRTYRKGEAPEDYYVKGYASRRRTIDHKVLIYIGAEPIAYVYIGADGLVEDVFVGGS